MKNVTRFKAVTILGCCIGSSIYNMAYSEEIPSSREARAPLANTPLMEKTISQKPTSDQNFTIITGYNYDKVIDHADNIIDGYYRFVAKTAPDEAASVDDLVNLFLGLHIPYAFSGAMGEGRDNCAPGDVACMNVKQDPMYRLDTQDCFTLVQDFMAMLQSSKLSGFKANLVDIAYGALENENGSEKYISYLNRNNFTSSDFDRVNQLHHRLQDVTDTGFFRMHPFYMGHVQTVIDHANWFSYQAKQGSIKGTVRVLPEKASYGNQIAAYFSSGYGNAFNKIDVGLDYIRKTALATQGDDGRYSPNDNTINHIPTPSVVEIVRDPSKWLVGGKPIKNIIGTDLLVSHVGILYRKTFKYGETIYQKTTCAYDGNKEKVCDVTPVVCKDISGSCVKTMMLVATSAFPNGFVYSHNRELHSYACTDPGKIPAGYVKLTTCNRVYTIPLGDYLTYTQYGSQINMKNPSILGVNIEKISFGADSVDKRAPL
jgi:hypothetical protein